jgi:hypothetical protein
MKARTKPERAWTLLWLMMLLMAGVLLTGCAKPVASESLAAAERELRAALPTWYESSLCGELRAMPAVDALDTLANACADSDTAETLDSGARFIAVFEAVFAD